MPRQRSHHSASSGSSAWQGPPSASMRGSARGPMQGAVPGAVQGSMHGSTQGSRSVAAGAASPLQPQPIPDSILNHCGGKCYSCRRGMARERGESNMYLNYPGRDPPVAQPGGAQFQQPDMMGSSQRQSMGQGLPGLSQYSQGQGGQGGAPSSSRRGRSRR
ncbi:hypothetical protein P171DRAFT_448201 [Karstenula rhodostoma CBS 690.94]|uniref:Uncharacterized protein n=1 Tax=Karstenula rhodostoma CBS 690.94 TaxID=1392251 RepID=A0A9P4P6N3_9PLEO|nr:hypothetical protein P171DRAFT_448201 [Karstenula rhodostoma CBS 690.94]